MLDEVPSQEFETFEILVEEHLVVLVSSLKGFDGPGGNGLEAFPDTKKLLVLLQSQLTFGPKVVAQSLHLLLQSFCLAHRLDQALLQLGSLSLHSLHLRSEGSHFCLLS